MLDVLHVLCALLQAYKMCTLSAKEHSYLFGGHRIHFGDSELDAEAEKVQRGVIASFCAERSARCATLLGDVGFTLQYPVLVDFSEEAVTPHFAQLQRLIWATFLTQREKERPALDAYLAEMEAEATRHEEQLSSTSEGRRKLAAVSGYDHGVAGVLEQWHYYNTVVSMLSISLP